MRKTVFMQLALLLTINQQLLNSHPLARTAATAYKQIKNIHCRYNSDAPSTSQPLVIQALKAQEMEFKKLNKLVKKSRAKLALLSGAFTLAAYEYANHLGAPELLKKKYHELLNKISDLQSQTKYTDKTAKTINEPVRVVENNLELKKKQFVNECRNQINLIIRCAKEAKTLGKLSAEKGQAIVSKISSLSTELDQKIVACTTEEELDQMHNTCLGKGGILEALKKEIEDLAAQ